MNRLQSRVDRARSVRDIATSTVVICLALIVLFSLLRQETAVSNPEARVEPPNLIGGLIDRALPYLISLAVISAIVTVAAQVALWLDRR